MLRALLIPILAACAVFAGSAPLVRKEMATGEGRISYQVRAGAGPRLILIHGSFNDNRQWDDVVPRLDAGLQLILVELRGHGQSWPPPANGSIEQFAADVARVAQTEGWDKFHVGGHSIGGMVALEIGRAYPQRVLGVLSSEGWTCHEALRDAFQGDTASTLTTEQGALRAARRERATGRWSDVQRKSFVQIWRRWNGYEFLKTTSIPILEAYGDRGRAKPTLEQLRIPERPNIRMQWMANASHPLPLEKPVELALAMNVFIRDVEARRVRATLVRKQISTGEGHVSYEVRPGGGGPGLILIPGSFHDNREWDQIVARLDSNLPLLLLELRGHGQSWPPPANGSIEQFASDVVRAADAEGWREFYVGGHSIGGMVALEIARMQPLRVAGVLSVEGWTNSAAPREAFPDRMSNTLTPELKASVDAERQAVTAKWTAGQKKAFAQCWRRWDGYEFLKTTDLPILEIYGDRGQAKPTAEQLRIPERANIRMHWIAGVSHWLTHERPAEVAAAMSGFLRDTNARRGHHPARLLADSSLLAHPEELAQARARHSAVFRGREGESQFNLHSYVAFHEGRFFAIWSSSKVGEEDPDQLIRYSTSQDGHRWAKARVLAGDPDGAEGPARWIARGLFVAGGKLHALGAYIESADYGKRDRQAVWKKLRLMRFEWNGKRWLERGVFADDCMNNFPPERLDARWLMVCRDSWMRVSVAAAGSLDDSRWERQPLVADPPFHRMDEPAWYEAPDGTVHLIIRDNAKSGYLIHVVSRDRGRTWEKPVLTNYPDATSKNYIGRFGNGWLYLINNPAPKLRDPLAISISRDGWSFAAPMIVRTRAGARRFEGRAKGSGTIQYPNAIEHAGSLWVIYSVNKEDIEISEIPLRAFDFSSKK
jgi:pimeloyl-ACP methyl ester carboxylesterase